MYSFAAYFVTSLIVPDYRFLVSIGDYKERKVNLWETSTCALLATTIVTQATHFIAWDPQAFNEFVTVGEGATIMFWLVDELTGKVPKLRVQEPQVPEDILASSTKVHVLPLRQKLSVTG